MSMILVTAVSGAAVLTLLGYLIGVRKHLRLIAGYQPGKSKDDEAVARSFRIWCFGGSIVILLVAASLAVWSP